MKPVRHPECRCPIYGEYIEHRYSCPMVQQRRTVLRLFASRGGVVCVFNANRRRIRTAKRRAGRQAA